jgi:mannonate dehydratase
VYFCRTSSRITPSMSTWPYPEHPRMFDYDRDYNKLQGVRQGGYPGGGGYTGTVFNVAYARAMMQAVLASM